MTCLLEEIIQHIKTNGNKKAIDLITVAVNDEIEFTLLIKFRGNALGEETNTSEIIEYISVCSSSNCNYKVRSRSTLINLS